MPNTHLLIGSGAHKVIALHGWFGHAHGWGPFTQHLNGRDFGYAFMDQRGYGGMRGSGGPYTMEQIAQDALALADHLGWRRFSLIGHSMGGSAIQQVLAASPERVRKRYHERDDAFLRRSGSWPVIGDADEEFAHGLRAMEHYLRSMSEADALAELNAETLTLVIGEKTDQIR